MSYQYDPNQQGQFPPENGNGLQQGAPPQGLPQQQIQQQQQGGQEGGSPAPFAQQGGVDGSAGSAAGGDAKTTLWYVLTRYSLSPYLVVTSRRPEPFTPSIFSLTSFVIHNGAIHHLYPHPHTLIHACTWWLCVHYISATR